jgi:lectin, mannose-binding 2
LRGSTIPSKAKLTYFQDKSLSLQLQYKTEGTWTDCFSVEAGNGVTIKIPNTAYLGFSAHTGELSDNFDIINVETRNLYNPVGSQTGKSRGGNYGKPSSKHASRTKKSGGWGWFFFKIVVFVAVCGGGYVGFNAYRTKKRYSSF